MHTYIYMRIHYTLFSTGLVWANAVSRVGPRNKVGHPARRQKRLKQVPVVSACGL